MPRRKEPDPLAEKIGARIRSLREAGGITQEKLAYESDVGSKGYLSDIEKGLARPTVSTLSRLAQRLEVDILDLVTFPQDSPRQDLVDRTRTMTSGAVRKLLREMRS